MTDTTTNIVLTAPRQRWWAWVPAIMAVVALGVMAISSLVPSEVIANTENPRTEMQEPAPYARIPAAAESVNNRVIFGELPDGVEVFDTANDFFFVTVSAPEQSVLSWLIGRDDPVVDLLTEEGRNGRRTATQNREISIQQMRSATQEAQFVALTAAGYEPTINLGPVVVEDLVCVEPDESGFDCDVEVPAATVLEPADTILEVNGDPVPTIDDLSAALEGAAPGDEFVLTIDRPQVGTLEVTVELTSSPDDPDRTIVGFVPFDTRTIDLPFDVAIETEAGGPSAGLAFTLALIDELTEGDLTGGRDIAVTGTIGLDGTVGPIGGLEQKVSAVQQHGVDVFLVPAGQIEFSPPPEDGSDDGICRIECLNDAGDGDVVLIKVGSLEEALAVLLELGGDPIPTPA